MLELTKQPEGFCGHSCFKRDSNSRSFPPSEMGVATDPQLRDGNKFSSWPVTSSPWNSMRQSSKDDLVAKFMYVKHQESIHQPRAQTESSLPVYCLPGHRNENKIKRLSRRRVAQTVGEPENQLARSWLNRCDYNEREEPRRGEEACWWHQCFRQSELSDTVIT